MESIEEQRRTSLYLEGLHLSTNMLDCIEL